MLNRREFLKSAAAAGALMSLGKMSIAESRPPIGIQLYTVRDLTREDFKGTLEKVAELGYPAFEFAGYGGMAAGEMVTFMEKLGVQVCGAHEGYNNFVDRADEVIEYNAALGNPYIVVPSMPHRVRNGSVDMVKDFADNLNRFGYKVKQAGMQLCYHNHSFEFDTVGGKTIFDWLMRETDAEMVKAEVDVAWVVNADVDPVALMDQYPDRVAMLHMKDLSKDKQLAPVGTGIVPIKKVIKKAKKIGVKWYIVEQDRTRPGKDILNEIGISYTNLAKYFD